MSELCQFCAAPAALRCGSCKKTRYCSAQHQKAFWKSHKLICGTSSFQPALRKWETDLYIQHVILPLPKHKNFIFRSNCKTFVSPNASGDIDFKDHALILGPKYNLSDTKHGSKTLDSILKAHYPDQDSSEIFYQELTSRIASLSTKEGELINALVRVALLPHIDQGLPRGTGEFSIASHVSKYRRSNFSSDIIDKVLEEIWIIVSLSHGVEKPGPGSPTTIEKYQASLKGFDAAANRLEALRKVLWDSDVDEDGTVFQSLDCFIFLMDKPEFNTIVQHVADLNDRLDVEIVSRKERISKIPLASRNFV